MYIEKGKKLTKQMLLNYLAGNKYCVEMAQKAAKQTSTNINSVIVSIYVQRAAIELKALNDALLKDSDVWVECTASPASLDRGKHWYQIWYAKGNKRYHFWAPIFMEKNRDGYYGFSSSAIGMSRVLDATDIVFATLKDAGGCYAQID